MSEHYEYRGGSWVRVLGQSIFHEESWPGISSWRGGEYDGRVGNWYSFGGATKHRFPKLGSVVWHTPKSWDGRKIQPKTWGLTEAGVVFLRLVDDQVVYLEPGPDF